MKQLHKKRALSLLLAAVMVLSLLAGCKKTEGTPTPTPSGSNAPAAGPATLEELGSGTVKWSEEKTADGWMRVTNDGGPTLGYMPDSGVKLLQSDGFAFKDLNKNGELDVYEDWRLDSEARATDLASKMEQSDILGLMLHTLATPESATVLGDGLQKQLDMGMRAFGNMIPGTTEEIIAKSNMMQAYAEANGGYGIPLDFFVEAGNKTTSQWVNNLGLGATFDPEAVAAYARTMSEEYRALGYTTLNTPQIDIASEPRWPRINGTFGEDPAMTRDMAVAYTNALQSSYDANGTDLGWGNDSMVANIKHFPGDGPGESGRESHTPSGKYVVYPGGELYTHMIPFEACMSLPGLTGSAAGVMPSYSIGIDAQGEALGGERVGSAFSSYKIQDLLKDELDFNGVVVTDYGIMQMTFWGMEDVDTSQRFLRILESGVDIICYTEDKDSLMLGATLYAQKHGEDALTERLTESATKIVNKAVRQGFYENPYVSVSESGAIVNSADKAADGFQVQLDSIVMLKNQDNLIQKAEGDDKPTVYIPYVYTEGNVSGIPGNLAMGAASWKLPINLETAQEYYNVVTDTLADPLTGPADKDGNPTASVKDIIRASDADVKGCDFALVLVDNPTNAGSRYTGYGHDMETDVYFPISLQYGPYTADSDSVRKVSLSGDIKKVSQEGTDDYANQTMDVKENRSYFGNASRMTNASHLDTILETAKRVDKVVVAINTTNPMVFSEFESSVDAIITHFGVSDKALLEVVSGKYEPSGLLPMQMPASMEVVEAQFEDVPRDMECHVDSEGNVYDFAFGLNWSGRIQDARTEKYDVAPLVG